MTMGTDERSSGAPSRPSSFKFAAAAVEPQHISTLGCKLTKQTTRYGTAVRADELTDIHLTRCCLTDWAPASVLLIARV